MEFIKNIIGKSNQTCIDRYAINIPDKTDEKHRFIAKNSLLNFSADWQ
jgi:hypothetical protein